MKKILSFIVSIAMFLSVCSSLAFVRNNVSAIIPCDLSTILRKRTTVECVRGVVDECMKRGRNWKAPLDRWDNTALHLACQYQDHNVFDFLLQSLSSYAERRAMVRATNKNSSTPLHFLAYGEVGDIETAKLLLAYGADIEAKENTKKDTPLIYAVRHHHIDLVKFFIRQGANVTYCNNGGDNVLHVAAYNSALQCLQYILMFPEVRAMINLPNNCGSTPIQEAINQGNTAARDILVANGAVMPTPPTV